MSRKFVDDLEISLRMVRSKWRYALEGTLYTPTAVSIVSSWETEKRDRVLMLEVCNHITILFGQVSNIMD